jgi:hypothetical protein
VPGKLQFGKGQNDLRQEVGNMTLPAGTRSEMRVFPLRLFGWRVRFLAVAIAVLGASLIIVGAASATICNNFGGTICCGNQSWGSFTNTNAASWSGDAGKRYYARRRDTNFNLTFNQLMPNGGSLFKHFGVVNFRGTGLYRGEQPLMNYAVSDDNTITGNC